jgi:hypothetical protein
LSTLAISVATDGFSAMTSVLPMRDFGGLGAVLPFGNPFH